MHPLPSSRAHGDYPLSEKQSSVIIDLDGTWEFHKINDTAWYPAKVPGCVHTDLQANGIIPDPFFGANELDLEWIEKNDFEYQKDFFVPREILNFRTIELVADGLDTLATITINDKTVAATENMFTGYRFAIDRLLIAGKNRITVRFDNPMNYIRNREGFTCFNQPNDPVGGASAIRKMQCSFGWDWGPRLPTCGIYRPIRIEACNSPRISYVSVKQQHFPHTVRIRCSPEIPEHNLRGLSWRSSIAFDGTVITQSPSLELIVRHPRLWWPNGSGAQPLYVLTVELLENNAVVDTWTLRIGLRTISLDLGKDEWGESFRFLVNGVPVYAKGASWVPAHSLPSSIGKEMYRDLIRSAACANFNMLRVWGGGLYEHDDFYDFCDEYGIMVWHDFMFACSLYPHDERFMRSVIDEASYQVRRLAHRACMALWCGNNELEQNVKDINATADSKAAYDRLFYDLLPKAVLNHAPHIPYWPSSPHNPDGYEKGFNSESAGDAHYWDVWHNRQPPESAHRHQYRFWSEFGMQAYCSVDTALQFADPDKLNIFGPAMENHQKHPAGNALIMHYIARRYRFPKDFAALVYLSQVNQAFCISLMVEHQRSCMPRTMGSLYWQLNDCWPVFSWSGIDFGGQWKALHYAARRFYAPDLVTFRLTGEERVGKINRQINTVSGVTIITVFDGAKSRKAKLRWDLYSIDDGKVVLHGEKPVTLRRNRAVVQKTLDLSDTFSRFAKNNLVMRIFLVDGTKLLSENTVLFTAPRFIELPKGKVIPAVENIGGNRFVLRFKSKTFQHQVSFHLPGTHYHASDNFFDLFPGVAHEVLLIVERDKPVSATWVKRELRMMSVADSY